MKNNDPIIRIALKEEDVMSSFHDEQAFFDSLDPVGQNEYIKQLEKYGYKKEYAHMKMNDQIEPVSNIDKRFSNIKIKSTIDKVN